MAIAAIAVASMYEEKIRKNVCMNVKTADFFNVTLTSFEHFFDV